MNPGSLGNRILDTIDEISGLASPRQIAATLARAVEECGYTSLGINRLPPPGADADPLILAERTPAGFRDCYIAERFYLVDHICAHARTSYEAFRYSEAPYPGKNAAEHKRFLELLDTFDLGKGLVVPIGRRDNIPTCMWLAGCRARFERRRQAGHSIDCDVCRRARRMRFRARPPPSRR